MAFNISNETNFIDENKKVWIRVVSPKTGEFFEVLSASSKSNEAIRLLALFAKDQKEDNERADKSGALPDLVKAKERIIERSHALISDWREVGEKVDGEMREKPFDSDLLLKWMKSNTWMVDQIESEQGNDKNFFAKAG